MKKQDTQYYVMGTNVFMKGYAYSDYERGSLDYDLVEKCPLCGTNISGAKSKQPYTLKLSTKKKIGDFTFGTFFYIVVSAKFKKLYEESDLTGIKEFRKIGQVKVRKEILDVELYAIILERVDVRVEPIESTSDDMLPICKLCNPYGKIYYSENGLKMDLNNQDGTPDIFMTYRPSERTYCTQKFVDFCKKNQLTDFEEQISRFEDYRNGIYSEAAKGW